MQGLRALALGGRLKSPLQVVRWLNAIQGHPGL